MRDRDVDEFVINELEERARIRQRIRQALSLKSEGVSVTVDRAEGLEEKFRIRSDKVIAELANVGLELRTFNGVRNPYDQAALWRQSRTRAEIEAGMKKLVEAGAPLLADILDSVGPQYGRWATDGLPGDSWHQFGEARDCVWIVKGGANWSVDDLVELTGPNRVLRNGYKEYTRIAKAMGLTPGGLWRKADFPHIQLRSINKPSAVWKWPDIQARMVERFGL